MTGTNIIKYTYKKPQESGNTILELDKQLEINTENLLVTLVQNGDDFIHYGPIDIIEKLFKEQEENLEFKDYLNNFDFKIEEAVKKRLSGYMRKLNPATTIYGENTQEKDKIEHSEKHLHQSIQEFRDDVNTAIKTCKLDPEEIKKMYDERQERFKQGKNKKGERREYIYKKIRPLYIQLRKEGYTSYDLTY